jgi:hypothetical protein
MDLDTASAIDQIVLGETTFSVSVKEWETEFFGRGFGSLRWNAVGAGLPDESTLIDVFGRLGNASDHAGVSVLECHLDVRDFAAAAALESVGFRLVDSRTRFMTRWSAGDITDTEPTRGRVLDATRGHRDRIIELTHSGFTHNDRFVSRFKNRSFFTPDETRRYFEAWIDNTAFEDNSASAVFEVDGEIVGYYVYQADGVRSGLPVVKGILTAVEPEHRGANAQLAMQAHLYRKLGFSEWYLDNTTQLTNLPVIRNHMRSGKQLDEILLTFYRTVGG